MMSAHQYVDSFFKEIGVGSAVKPEQFERLLGKRFGKIAAAFMDCVAARESGEHVDPYPRKNQSLEFANAVASQFDAAKLKAVAIWLINEQMLNSGQAVLEIGCDNGILLCLLASLQPDVSFVGIDPCSEAINVACQRAALLGLRNIEFRIGEVGPSLQGDLERTFDLVLSVTVFHEILANGFVGNDAGFVRQPAMAFSIDELDADSTDLPSISELAAVRALLEPNGSYVSVDRWRNEGETLRWIRLAEAAGLGVNLPRSYLLYYKDISNGPQVLPLTLFGPDVCHSPRACDVLAFKAYRVFDEAKALHRFDDPMLAELFYSALDKREVYFQEATYRDGSGTERIHCGVANGLGYVYSTTSRAYRCLELLPSALMSERAALISEVRNDRERRAEVVTRWGDPALLAMLGIVGATSGA